MKVRKCMEEYSKKALTTNEISTCDCIEYADPLFGVGSATSAGPTLPSSSIHPSPETLEKDNGGYLRNQPIVGFGHLYNSGSGGTKCYGNFLLAPMVDGIKLTDAERASFAVAEKSRCYEYTVELENGIKIKYTPAHNSVIYTVEYPGGKEASLLLDVGRKQDIEACMKKGNVTVDPEKMTALGGGTCTGNWSGKDWDMFFAMAVDTKASEIGTYKGDQLSADNTGKEFSASIDDFIRFGIYMKFPLSDKPLTVRIKLAISFVSAQKAKSFLDEQIPAFDYDGVREEARKKWSKTLGVIQLKSDDKALLRRFYTAMYHMNVQPRNRLSDHGKWDDFHTIWDSWKTVFPMYSLLYPDKMASIIESCADRVRINKEKKNGMVLGDALQAGEEANPGQGGNDMDNVLVDAYMKGIVLERYDWEDIYKILLDSAENMRSKQYIENGFVSTDTQTVSGVPYSWRFKPASATLGLALNDKAIATVAKELGTQEEYEKYEKRSANWRNVWNHKVESEGFYGFPQKRNEDGSFDEGYDAHGGYNSYFYEATGWDASYINYNDVSRLVETMGGAETFTKRLLWACDHSRDYYNDDHGKEGYLNFTNEPSFHIPWLFCTDEIKRPDLASKVIDKVIERFSLENDYPGDEDNGGMSSYYVFLMCGFFPYATTENYYLHGTRVEEIAFNLGNGKKFTVTGENVGGNNIYVQSATWQGKEYNQCKLLHRQILEGGEFHFVMGDTPSDWGRN